MEPTEYEQLHIVAYALIYFIEQATEKLAAIEAYEAIAPDYVIPKEQIVIHEMAYQSIRDSLVVDAATLFDSDKTRGNANCSLLELKVLLKNDINKQHPAYIRDKLIERIDTLNSRCKIKALRNKQKAHHDLAEAFEKNNEEATTQELKALLDEAWAIVSDTFEMVFGAIPAPKDHTSTIEKYKQSLLSCIGTSHTSLEEE